jgi:Na+-driven multidrug efflux pump
VALLSKARYSLAAIRIVNGLLALVAPSLIIKRFGENPDQDAAAVYGLRLFGVRTVLIGADLITQRGEALEHTIDQAVVIHASDTLTAAALGKSGRLRPRMAVPLTLISAVNTTLAVAAWLHARREAKP